MCTQVFFIIYIQKHFQRVFAWLLFIIITKKHNPAMMSHMLKYLYNCETNGLVKLSSVHVHRACQQTIG